MPADRTKARDRAKLDALILKKHRAGQSTRAIATALLREHGVQRSKTAVQKRIDAAGATGERVRRSSRRKPRASAPPAANGHGAPRAVASEEETLATAAAAGIDDDIGDEDLDSTRARLRRLRALITKSEKAAFAGDIPFATWANACRLEADLATKIASHIVPEPVKPEDDPAHAETATKARTKLARLVRAAEEVTRCESCGKPPWPTGKATP